MFLMYVDESGDTGLVNSPTRYFVLTGLVVHELRWEACLKEILNFRVQMRRAYGLKLREEIHATDLVNNPAPSLKRIAKHDRLAIIRHFADCLGALQDISLISVALDKSTKTAGYNVFEKAWTALTQRFENTMNHGNFRGPKNSDERGMLICDHTDDMKLTRLVRKMRAYNPIPNQAGHPVGPGYRNMALKYVIEDPNFRDSKHALFIQAVDTTAWLLKQLLQPCKYMRHKGGHAYFDRLQSIFCRVCAPRDPRGIVRL